jgi:hypothetical protein
VSSKKLRFPQIFCIAALKMLSHRQDSIMDNSTRECIIFLKRILKGTQELQETVAAIAEYSKAEKESKDAALRKPAGPIRTETDFSPRVMQTYQSNEDSSYRLQRNAYRVGFVTLVVLGLYTLATWRLVKVSRDSLEATKKSFTETLCQMQAQTAAQQNTGCAAQGQLALAQRSLGATINSFHLEQRAWMNVLVGKAALQDGSPINMPIRIINSGKTPAHNVQGVVVINLLEEKDQPDFNYRSGHPRYAINTGIAIPNFPSDMSWPVLPKHVPKGKPVNPIVTTSEIRTGIQDGSLYIVVHGRITYDDIFGTKHWIKFCSYAHNVVGVPEQFTADTCGPYNDVDKNN